jgi:hypothetical protein
MKPMHKCPRPIMNERYQRCSWLGLGLFVIIAIAACVSSEPQSTILPSPSLTASPPILLQTPYPTTATRTMLPTSMPTSTATPVAPSLRLDELAPGQYVAYEKVDGMDTHRHDLYGLHLVSIDGVYQGRLAFLGRGGDSVLSPDGTRLAVSLYAGLQMMSLLDYTLAPIPGGEYCYGPSWSPDGSALAADCDGGAISDIYVLYPESGERVLLTGWRDPLSYDYFVHPQWSPDGKWIAFRNGSVQTTTGMHYPGQGLYLTKTECLSDLSTCQAATHGPIRCYGEFSWSPDSQMLACVDLGFGGIWIRIFTLDGRVMRTLPIDDIVWALAWSPDGKWIALTMDNLSDSLWYTSVYIISVDGKELTLLTGEPLEGNDVRFWVTIP